MNGTSPRDEFAGGARAEDPIAHALGLLYRTGQKALSDAELKATTLAAASEAVTKRYLRVLE